MNQEPEKTKISNERSVAYPSITLSDAIDYVKKLKETLGKGPYSRDEAAKALGHAKLSGPASRKVAALVHYGLLERTGNAYVQTQLSQDILAPVSDLEKNEAIVRAAHSPKLFEKLIQKYNGQALPTMLQNILAREGINESVAGDVVRIFTETIKFAGLYVNGIVTENSILNPDVASIDISSETNSFQKQLPLNQSTSVKPTLVDVDEFTFDFDGGIKLTIPKNRTTSEAIADGELKNVRIALSEFSKKFMKSESQEDL